MKIKKAQTYNVLLKERQKLIKKLADVSFVLRGTLRRHGNICGNPKCRCKHPTNPKLHGPYDYLSHRYKDKTQTIYLNKKKLMYSKEGIGNYKKMLKVIYRLSEINFRILRYHYDKLEEKK